MPLDPHSVTRDIVTYVVEFMTAQEWRVSKRKARRSESWYLWLRKDSKCVQLRVSLHAKRPGWKTVCTRKQAKDFMLKILKER